MQRVAFAVGDRKLEDYLRAKLKNEFHFVGASVFREGVVRLVGQTMPNILILKESLEGNEDILKVIYELQLNFENLRIIYLAGGREAGDALLSTLVSYGIYDVLHGKVITAEAIVRLMRTPNKRTDVMYLQPKPTLDEKGKVVLFEAPDVSQQKNDKPKEVIKEIFVETDIGDKELIIQAQEEKERKKQRSEDNEKDATVNQSEQIGDIGETVEDAYIEEIKEPIVESKEKKGFFFSKKDSKTQEDKTEETPSIVSVQKQTNDEEKSSNKGFFSRFIPKEVLNHEQARLTQSIVTFVGMKSGVGNTSLAFNTALTLAKKHKVLYVEMDDKSPVVPVWYDLSCLDKGIETALEAIENGQVEKIKENILTMDEIRNLESDMIHIHKKLPDNIDILTFSKRFTLRFPGEMKEPNYQLSRELYLYLLYQSDYNYVILDVPSDVFHPATFHAVTYSNYIYFTLTQDIASISKADYYFHELEKQNMDISKKVTLLINRYDKNVNDLKLKKILEWLHIEKAICVPDAHVEFMDANFLGVPFSMHENSNAWKNVWKSIIQGI